MKKILSCLGVALFTFSFSYSQGTKNKMLMGNEATTVLMLEESNASQSLSKAPQTNQVNAGGDTIYSQTFSGGMPAGWTQSGPDQIWKWIDTAVYKTPGCYSAGTARLKSTTATGGTMIFDGDSAIRGGGACPPTIVAKTGALVSPAINLTGKTGVHLKYQQKFRLCCNTGTTSIRVMVSGDGGVTWADTLDSRHGVGLNQTPLTNPDMMDFNISCTAGGSANAMIKFEFTSKSGTYYWELDDVAIVESYSDDLVLKSATINWASPLYSVGFWGVPDLGGFYSKTPFNQINTLKTFDGTVTNDGVNTQTNVKVNVDITTSSSVYNQNTTPTVASYAPCTPDTFLMTSAAYTPSALGVYTTTFSLQQTATDQNPANNTIIQVFEITDSVYARDNDNVTTTTVGPSNYTLGQVNECGLGNLYEIFKDDEAMAVEVYVGANTNNGASIEAGIYQVSDPSNTFVINPNATIVSQIYDVVDSTVDAGKWVTLPLVRQVPNDYKLYKDSVYIVGVKNYNESTSKLRMGSDLVTQQPAGASWLRLQQTGMTTFSWGYITITPRIRLLTRDFTIGINELAANGLSVDQNFPNPHSGQTLINYEVNKSSKVTLEVYDITGNLVYSQNEGSVAAGKHSIELNTKLATGAYTYTLRANETSLTKKMMVTN